MNMMTPPQLSGGIGTSEGGRGLAALKTDAREVFRMLDRRKWQMFGVVLLTMILVAISLAQITPTFRATATVMLDSRKFRVTKVEEVLSSVQAPDLAALQTEVEILRSRSLLGRVVRKLELQRDPEFGGADSASGLRTALAWARTQVGLGPATSAPLSEATIADRRFNTTIDRLSEQLTIMPRGRSYVIALSVGSADGAKAARIANVVASEYIIDQLHAKIEANKRGVEFLNERLTELRRASEAADTALARFRQDNNITAGRDATVSAQSLSEINTQLNIANTQLAERESRLVQLQTALRNPGGATAITEVLTNPLIGALRAQEAEVARVEAELAQRYGDNHPRLIQSRAQLADLRGKIGGEIGKIVAAVRSEVEAARSKVSQLKEQLGAAEKRSGAQGQTLATAKQLERDADSNRAILDSFMTRYKELREQQEIQQPDARELSNAMIPVAPSSPRYIMILIIAFVAATLIAIALAVLLERLDGGYRSSEQIEARLGLPAIGMIPALSALTLRGSTLARFVVDKASSSYGESLRSTHTAMMLGNLDSPPKVVMVTSSLPGEGKTTFSVSLASMLAKSNPGKKIVVVDCDLRRSAVVKSLGVKAMDGTLDEYLSGAKPLEAVLGRDEHSGLYFISARSNTPNSVEVLDSNAMKRFIGELSATYDLVVLDTPPVMAVSDARIVSRLADYVIFLVRWERTPREVVGNAVRLLRDVNRRVGVVMAQVNVRRHSKYGYGDAGYYYSKYGTYYNS